jgi:fatty-acyl-CoA synthase
VIGASGVHVSSSALSYISGITSAPLLGETLGACLRRIAAAHPDADALVSRHQNLRYRFYELDREVDRVASGLLALGIERGDRVGIWSLNSVEAVLAQYASARIGALFVTINPGYRRSELEHALHLAGVSALVIGDGLSDLPGSEGLLSREVRANLPLLAHVIVAGPGGAPDSMRWSDLLARGRDVSVEALRAREAACQFDDPAAILFTSGTTGAPKGATLSHHTVVNCGYFMGERLGYTTADRLCVPVAFYHCLGCVMANVAALTHGSAVVLPGPRFEAGTVLEAIDQDRCTALYGVPTMFIELLGQRSRNSGTTRSEPASWPGRRVRSISCVW